MAKLKLAALPDDKSIKVTVELPAAVHRDLIAYADILSREAGQSISDPARLIVPMLARFMATDRAFARLRRGHKTSAADHDRSGVPALADAPGRRKS
ncbi:MAG: DUF2274 domain-containing protein [Bradyrhizobium sp.]|uniref:DUF2274 domain-containing protein n=1 Tax=Bradyrhizobium sp. TaxID=376 RepID=UPI001D308E57|nr:DUF2274 domain-containing protein [Bradyrhizobium sp.]MBV9565100.1 DUF2274 domain-containing protein [Bradyrhizobium sp.]